MSSVSNTGFRSSHTEGSLPPDTNPSGSGAPRAESTATSAGQGPSRSASINSQKADTDDNQCRDPGESPLQPAVASLVAAHNSSTRTEFGLFGLGTTKSETVLNEAVLGQCGAEGCVTVAGARLQTGDQTQLNITGLRVNVGTEKNYLGAEGFTASLGAGSHNADGSVGANASATATLVGGTLNLEKSGYRLALGASVGVGAAASVGVRDADADGTPEACASASLGPVSIGVCIESARLAGLLYDPRSASAPNALQSPKEGISGRN
jgi:hypothetical protein